MLVITMVMNLTEESKQNWITLASMIVLAVASLINLGFSAAQLEQMRDRGDFRVDLDRDLKTVSWWYLIRMVRQLKKDNAKSDKCKAYCLISVDERLKDIYFYEDKMTEIALEVYRRLMKRDYRYGAENNTHKPERFLK